MGFKLGANRGNYAVSGEIKTKMRFGKQAGGPTSVPGTPIIPMPLEEGILGEANMDGTIYVNENLGFVAFSIMCVIMIVDLVTGYVGKDLIINEFVYDSFVFVVLGCFGISGVEKFAKK